MSVCAAIVSNDKGGVIVYMFYDNSAKCKKHLIDKIYANGEKIQENVKKTSCDKIYANGKIV